MKKEKIIELVWFVVVLMLFIVSIQMTRSGQLQEQISSFGIFAPIVIIILKISTLVIAPLGGTPLYIIAGALFGSWYGFLLCFAGDIVGSSICFWLSRRYGTRVLKTFAGSQNVERVLKTVNIIGDTKSFIKARIGFISIPELLAYAAGLSQINFWKYSIINAAFYIPVDLVLAFFGAAFINLSAKYIWILPAIVLVAAVVGFGLLYKDYQKTEGM